MVGIAADQLPEAIDRWLPQAIEYAEAGFYYEEGGCVGMALALFDVFKEAGLKPRLARTVGFAHVGVVVGGRFFDSQGAAISSMRWEPLTRAQFQKVADEWAQDDNTVAADKSAAADIIVTAVELAEERGLD
jgi:hypothetical protein